MFGRKSWCFWSYMNLAGSSVWRVPKASCLENTETYLRSPRRPTDSSSLSIIFTTAGV